MKHTFNKNGIQFEIDLTPDRYNSLRVIARHEDKTERGEIGTAGQHIYPRIDFKFVRRSQWLIQAADKRYWGEDDDTDHDLPCSCEFSIPRSDLEFMQKLAVLPQPRPSYREDAKIILRMGTAGCVDEKKPFDTIDQLQAFLSARGIDLGNADYQEIMRHPDTQFDHSEMISDDGINGYWGVRRYEITVQHG
jgi:hypothetical protein